MNDPLFITAISKDEKKVEKKVEKKKLKNERLNFENPIFWCFPDFLQNFAVNDFLKSFAEWLTRFWFFSFLKIIFRHWIWNEIPDLEQNCCFKIVFCLLFRNGCLELVACFLALVALKCICCVFRFENVSWAGVALKIFFVAFLFEFFLALIASKMIFCSCRFENDFLLLLLWKLFLAPVALKNVCRLPLWKLFFVLFPLNLILGASRFENFLVFLWKCLFGGHRFENSFLALVVLKIVFWHLSIFEKFLRS